MGRWIASLALQALAVTAAARAHGPLIAQVAGAPAAQAVPFACGLFARAPLRGVDVVVDGRGRPLIACLHRRDAGRVLVHGVLSSGCRELRRGSKIASAAGLRVVAAGADLRVEGTGARVELLAQGRLRVGSLHVSPVPQPGAGGGWRVVHACAARVDALFEGFGPGAVALRLVVSLHADLPRLDLGLHATATKPCGLRDGLGWRVSGSSLELSTGAGPLARREGTGLRVLRRRDRWERDELDVGDAAQGIAIGVVGESGSLWTFALPSGRGVRLREGALAPDGCDAVLLHRSPGTGLALGEGALVRVSAARGRQPPPPAPLVLPVRRVAVVRGGVAVPGPGPTHGLDEEVGSWVGAFLSQEQHGLLLDGDAAGDWRFSANEVGNLEYDTVLGLLWHALRRGSPEAWDQARACADHLCGADRDAAGSGLFFPHGRGHRTSGIEAGHHWVEGLILMSAWTEDPLYAKVVREVVSGQLRTFPALVLAKQYPRSRGWGLLALTAGAPWGEDRRDVRREIRRWRRHLVSRQTASGMLALVSVADSKRTWRANPYVQGGILAPAFARSLEEVPSAAHGSALKRWASALLRESVVATEQGPALARRIFLDFPSGQVTARTGAASGEHAALFLAGLAQASPGSRKNSRWRALRGEISRSLRIRNKTLIGPELSILLRAIPFL